MTDTREIFERLGERGRAAVAERRHGTQVPPVDGGERWGISVLLRPDGATAAELGRLGREASSAAGSGHWITGAVRSSHLTVRALERHRVAVPEDDPAVARYTAALRAAAAGIGPLRFRITGVALTPTTVMAHAEPVDDRADGLAAAFGRELGPDGWFEDGFDRDLWYLNLVHFAADIPEPAALIEWVERRRGVGVGEVTIGTAQIAQWRHRGGGMVPRVLARVPLGG